MSIKPHQVPEIYEGQVVSGAKFTSESNDRWGQLGYVWGSIGE